MRKLIEILFVFLFVTLVSVHAKLNPYDMVHRDIRKESALSSSDKKKKTSVPERYAQWFADSEMQRFPEA